MNLHPRPGITAALMVVRNEQHIIASSIGHLLTTVGVDRIYVMDNGSTDATPDILQKIARLTGQLVIDSDPGAYRQGEIATALAHRAMADGATWLLPTDADEFLWLRPGQSLATLSDRADIGGYRVEMCNFLQARMVRREWPGALAFMAVAAVPTGSVADAQALVEAGEIPFIRITYPTKVVLRAAPSLEISFGSHDATGTAGPLVKLIEGELLHAPMRSFDSLHQRAESGRRTQLVTPEPGQNWHLKRVTRMDPAELEIEWRKNSFSLLRPAATGTRVDWRLSRIARRQAGFRRQLR